MTEEEAQYLRDNSASMPLREMARHLGKTIGAVHRFAVKHKLPRYIARHGFWTKPEVARLHELAKDCDYSAIAAALGRREHAVTRKAKALGL